MSRKIFLFFMLILTSCLPQPNTSTPAPIKPPLSEQAPTPNPLIPNFKHIVWIVFENREYDTVIDNPDMPMLNLLVEDNAILTNFYALAQHSLPNYIGLIGGDTYGYSNACDNCAVNAPSLPDLIEQSNRTWKAYQESMPVPCLKWNFGDYAVRHNPFMYFSPIVDDTERCKRHVVPLTELYKDEEDDTLPDFIFITPNICNSGHDCSSFDADEWLEDILPPLYFELEEQGPDYLIVLTWDEGTSDEACCGLPTPGGGRVATVLISPHVKSGFKDGTQYTTYSLLRTVSEAWGLPLLGHAADKNNALITAPWE